jgi:excisionase family DNA binding protein
MKKLLRPREVSEALGVSRGTPYLWAKNGELPCVRMGKSIRFDTEDINAFIERNKDNTIKI